VITYCSAHELECDAVELANTVSEMSIRFYGFAVGKEDALKSNSMLKNAATSGLGSVFGIGLTQSLIACNVRGR